MSGNKSLLLEDEPLAVDILARWLEKHGFALQPDEHSRGFYTKNTSGSTYWGPGDPWERALIQYRGNGSLADCKAKLLAVSEVLDRLGVNYSVALNRGHFPVLSVTLSDKLWADLPAEEAAQTQA